MTINPEITKTLQEHNVNVNEALTVLIILYFNLEEDNQIINDTYIRNLSNLRLIDYDFWDQKYIFLKPVFLDVEPPEEFDDEFIKQYIAKFTAINKDRRAPKNTIVERLKKLQKSFPDVTRQEILAAVDLHISRLRSPEYLKQADYFIWKKDEGFNIMKYIEEIRDGVQPTTGNFDIL